MGVRGSTRVSEGSTRGVPLLYDQSHYSSLTGEGLAEGLDWLSAKLSERMQAGFHNPNDHRGVHISKMP